MQKRQVSVILVLFFLFTIKIYASLIEEALFISKLYEDGFYDLAIREIAKVEIRLENDRYSHQILSIKADILLSRNDLSEAKEILVRLNTLSLNPALKGQVMLSLAKVEKALLDYSEAFDLIQLFMIRFPDNEKIPEAQLLLGEIYFEQGSISDAENIFLSLHENEKSLSTFKNLIRIYVHDQQLSEAENLLIELQESFPRAEMEYQQSLLYVLNAYEKGANYLRMLEITPDTFDEVTIFTEAIIQKKVVANINLRNFEAAEQLLLHITEDTSSINYYRALIHKEREEFHLALPIFRVLARGEGSQVLRTMSFFNMVQIIARNDTDEAYYLLTNFLLENPDQEWEGDILYQLAFIEFQNDNFQKSYEYTLGALRFHLNEVNKQRAIYLKGELEFLLNNYAESYETYSNNLDIFSEIFMDEVLFKMGLNNFFMENKLTAFQYFTRLITEYPFSQKVGVAYFYLGELLLYSNTLQARSYYQQAMSGEMDSGVINLRLSYVDFRRNEFNSALDILNLVPETSDFIYDKYVLKGNIMLAQRDFNQSLEAFRTAERNAKDQISVEYIWSMQALLHYNMQNYDTATAIYRRLAAQSETPGRFIISAARAAFNADNFQQAVELFLEYIDTYPESPELFRAESGLANSYYNLGLYDLAIDVWKNLISDNNPIDIVESSLKGLQDSYHKLDGHDLFSEFLLLAIFRSQDKDFLIALYEFKANYEYEQRNYNASVSTINQMLRQYPEKREDLKTMILLANNYTWLHRYGEADQIYIDLSTTHNDPFIFYEWGHIKWAQGDFVAALRRYKRAVENSRNEQYWLVLLEKMIEQKDPEFTDYFNSFVAFASPYHKSLATLYQIDWLIHINAHTEALDQTNLILTSDNSQIRARATFKRGEIFFALREYDESISNFLRLRYVFNEFSELRWVAELYVAKIHVLQGDRERGLQLFNSIRGNLKEEQIAEFNALL